jgi:hypothetical protein
MDSGEIAQKAVELGTIQHSSQKKYGGGICYVPPPTIQGYFENS